MRPPIIVKGPYDKNLTSWSKARKIIEYKRVGGRHFEHLY